MNVDNNSENLNKDVLVNTDKKKLRPCCACPETKILRDKCIFENGEENCLEYLEKHKACLRDHGFLVD